jgi:octopine oxidase subunit B
MVGGAIAYGCASHGARTIMLDEGDVALRAARGNFGLVWSQGKGVGMPAYTRWTGQSLGLWPGFAELMGEAAGQAIGYRRVGGLAFCVGEEEFEERRDRLLRLHNQDGGPATPVRLLDRKEVDALLPNTRLGPRVLGASLAPDDGHVNPLLLLRGLHAGFLRVGGVHRPGTKVAGIDPGFSVRTEDGVVVRAGRVVVAAGLGTPRLAAMLGMDVPVRPVRGQNMVTERLAPLLPMPASAVRQTEEGVVQIGVSEEEGEWEPATRVAELARMARRAIEVLPDLARARVVRSWGALRPMTPDGFPAYAQSGRYPGAFAAVCHSGVTLSAAHAGPLAEGILTGALPETLAPLHPARFHVHAH